MIASLIPQAAAGDTFLLAFPGEKCRGTAGLLLANWCSFVLDFAARQKTGGTHLKYHVFKQLPVLPPQNYDTPCPWNPNLPTLRDWLAPRVLELVYTAWDLQPFAEDCGYDGPPFRWDPARRFQLRAELDAAFFHLYGVSRDDADYILETFPIVKRHDVANHGEYRTKRAILEAYDALAHAAKTGQPYATPLAAPPADRSVAHAPREERPSATVIQLYPQRDDDLDEPLLAYVAEPEAPYSEPPRVDAEPEPVPTAAPEPPRPSAGSSTGDLPRVLAWLRSHPGPQGRAYILAGVGLSEAQWNRLRPDLEAHPDVDKSGAKRGTRYTWIGPLAQGAGEDRLAVLRSVRPDTWRVPADLAPDRLAALALLAALRVLPAPARSETVFAVARLVLAPERARGLVSDDLVERWNAAVAETGRVAASEVGLLLSDGEARLRAHAAIVEDLSAGTWTVASEGVLAEVDGLEWLVAPARAAAAAVETSGVGQVAAQDAEEREDDASSNHRG